MPIIITETKLISSQAHAAVVLIRLMVGAVFFLKRIQKILYPETLDKEPFAKTPCDEFEGTMVKLPGGYGGMRER